MGKSRQKESDEELVFGRVKSSPASVIPLCEVMVNVSGEGPNSAFPKWAL